jgi:ferredoxin
VTLVIDTDKCQGHGRCVLANPDLFDVDDEGYGQVLIADPGPEYATDVQSAIMNCPEQAISLT